jgi:hypothetical protein
VKAVPVSVQYHHWTLDQSTIPGLAFFGRVLVRHIGRVASRPATISWAAHRGSAGLRELNLKLAPLCTHRALKALRSQIFERVRLTVRMLSGAQRHAAGFALEHEDVPLRPAPDRAGMHHRLAARRAEDRGWFFCCHGARLPAERRLRLAVDQMLDPKSVISAM